MIFLCYYFDGGDGDWNPFTLLYILIDDQSGETCEDNHDDGVNTVKTGADEGEEENEQARDELERAF